MASLKHESNCLRVNCTPSELKREVLIPKQPKRADVEIKIKPAAGPFPGQNGGA
jgi:hypothetical protein